MVSPQPRASHPPGAGMTGIAPAPAGPIAAKPAAEAPDASGPRPAERAYAMIRDAILSGALPAGAHLREEALAQMAGASRTPVREALMRLVSEGLAVTENRHRYVADFSLGEVEVIFDLRARMESYAAGIAARRITGEEVARLSALVERIDTLGDGPDASDDFFALNSQFHAIIIAATRSSQLRALTAQALALPLVGIKRFVCDQGVDIQRSNAQHRDIVSALARRDAEWAALAMMGHIISTKPVVPGADIAADIGADIAAGRAKDFGAATGARSGAAAGGAA